MKVELPGTVSSWNDFIRHDFEIEGIQCVIVEPKVLPAKDRPWYWRARFFGAFPYVDMELLKRGWHVVNIDISELYGSPEAMRRMDLLYSFMVQNGFAPKCALAGFSRGGLDSTNWTLRHPDRVQSLYLDNPVCDFKSWPGGKGSGPGSADGWRNCLSAWGLTEEEAMEFKGNPIDNLQLIADKKVPVLIACGDADEVVPAEENTMIVEKRLKEMGGNITVIYKPGAKHHPHSFEEPSQVIEFIEKARSKDQY